MDDAQEVVLYRAAGPSNLRSALPETFSFSSLRSILQCPLRWQLERSQYGELEQFPNRPNVHALAGQIVHELLEELFRRLTTAGLPEQGTAEFRAVIGEVEPRQRIRERIDEFESEREDHPRTLQSTKNLDVSQLFRQVTEFFASEYSKVLNREGVLSKESRTDESAAGGHAPVLNEKYLRHPDVPFHGVVDLLYSTDEGWVVADFKTGEKREYHRWQVSVYGLLWHRNHGEVPVRGDVVYPSETVSWPLGEERMRETEEKLLEKMQRARRLLEEQPASPTPGDHCEHCDVRQYCEAYWPATVSDWDETWLDVELRVTGVIDKTAIQCVAGDDRSALLSLSPELSRVWGPFEEGDVLRVRSALLTEESGSSPTVVKLVSSSEVFRVGTV